jgi:lipopolysaccharide assembly protein B
MEFEIWWLLALPIFFAMGWLAARIDIKQLLSESRSLPASYFKGLNFLLNEQPDKAIDAFIEVSKLDPNTVELQFALGSLFRRRGEVDRAIRMHHNLTERSDLDAEQKQTAHFELAQDYLKAGLLDRAEQLFSGLTQTTHRQAVLKFLLDIYRQEKDWLKAIPIAKELEGSSTRNFESEIANYYCELATTEYVHARHETARGFLQQALAADRKCVRANILLGEWQAKAGKHQEAIEIWKAIESQSPEHLSLVADEFLQSYRALGKLNEGLGLLRGFQERYPALDLLNVVFQGTLETEGSQSAYKLVRDDLRRNPTLLGLDKLVEARLMETPVEERSDVQMVKDIIHGHTTRMALYQCETCGFRARQFYWHCPACGGWDTYPPRRNAELELTERRP